MQVMFARLLSRQQLQQMGVLEGDAASNATEELDLVFKNSMFTFHFITHFIFCGTDLLFFLWLVWADNADVMSRRYTGTGALKTDFTRTGKRSIRGIIAYPYP